MTKPSSIPDIATTTTTTTTPLSKEFFLGSEFILPNRIESNHRINRIRQSTTTNDVPDSNPPSSQSERTPSSVRITPFQQPLPMSDSGKSGASRARMEIASGNGTPKPKPSRITQSPLSKTVRLGKASRRERPRTRRVLSLVLSVILVSGTIFPGPCLAWKSSSRWPSRSLSGDGIGARFPNRRTRRREGATHPPAAKRRSVAAASSIRDDDDDGSAVCGAPLFPTHRPLLAVITETDACDSEQNSERTLEAIRKAVSTGGVDLVSVRLSLPPGDENENVNENDNGDGEKRRKVLERARVLTEQLVALSAEQRKPHPKNRRDPNDSSTSTSTTSISPPRSSFCVVCSSDLVPVAVEARAHGVHVKEHHLDRLPEILAQFDYPIVVGTSAHSVESAVGSRFGSVAGIRPDYYFVGTCYLTASHPEKTSPDQLEGPELPGRVKRALSERTGSLETPETRGETMTTTTTTPRVFAIGGIDETNCRHPVALGADGVAVIRAVLRADSPSATVRKMQDAMATAVQTKGALE